MGSRSCRFPTRSLLLLCRDFVSVSRRATRQAFARGELENIDLARDRAQGISTYLQKQGVAGEYTSTISTTFAVDAAKRTARSIVTDTITKAELEKPAESSAGKPLSTATISFESPQST